MELFIDTDMGADDALAIAIAVRSGVTLPLISTVSGNVPAQQAVRNVGVLLGAIRGNSHPVDAPEVVVGAGIPLKRTAISATSVFGADGMGGTTATRGAAGEPTYPAATLQISKKSVSQHWLELDSISSGRTLVALGPLTNLAQLALTHPGALSKFDSIVAMGGAFNRPGNITPFAEFNVFADPDAAAVVFEHYPSLRLIPLDVTSQVFLEERFLRAVAGAHEGLARFMYQAHSAFLQWNLRKRGIASCHPHDSIAVVAALYPDAFEFLEMRVDVELNERAPNRGQTVVSPTGLGPVAICIRADHDLINHEIEKVLTR